MKKRRILFVWLVALVATSSVFAQRTTDKLDRGVVAVPAASGGGNFVSWRILGEEYYDTQYNLYRDGVKLNSTPLDVSNYQDASGTANSTYQVAAVVRGVEQEKSTSVKAWAQQYLEIPVAAVTDRNGADASADYTLNDVSLADLDGDGISEFIVKRACGVAADVNQKVRFHQLDCYDHKGNRLWWIDLGPNMLAGADEQWDAVAYDWDGDGKAEVVMRGQDNMIIHHADGTTTTIGDTSVDTRWNGIEYTSTGNEYLLYLEGATAKPYQIGPTSHPDYMDYPLTRGLDTDWGSGIVGHRSTKHFFGAPFLDGRHASMFIARGIYTKHKMIAYDVNPETHALSQRWTWECSVAGPWFGQGYHNYAIADVDWDGRDEIVYGSMVIDDNGKGLSTTGLGHGDAQHCSDLDPYRHGHEQFACNEDQPAMNYRDATTSTLYYRAIATSDDGRALCANFTNDYPGSVGRSVSTGWVSSVADKVVDALGGDAFINWGDLNWRIYWDGDLCDEYLESPGTENYAVVYKPGTGARILSATGTKLNNYTKNNPGAVSDLFGDWREEIVVRNDANTALRVYTTNIPTTFRNYTLWHDHQYRNAMVWQCLGYNQPPHKSYFLGEMEGITVAPPPLTMTGRTEVPNGGTITSEDKHFIVCETNDTEVTIAEGASPYIVTFNVPTWVQGTAGSNSTSANTQITTTTYTCNVKGGALTGETKVIKQGDGVLNLPKVDMAYTGATNIWAGTLNFDGTLRQSPLWLNRFAELNSNGGEFKSIKADYGSIIRPGGKDAQGTMTVNETLELGFGSRIVFDLDGETLAGDRMKAKTIRTEVKSNSPIWKSYGPKTLQPVIEINGTGLVPGSYVIAEVENLEGNIADFKLEGTGSFKSELVYADGKITLILGDTREAGSVVWMGQESAVWDFAKTENFIISGEESSTPTLFVTGDKVEFNDDASKFAVNITEEISADTIWVNSTKAYSFTGTGSITEGALVKEGTGTLTISTDNAYTGGNYLRGGVVKVSSLSNDVLAHGNLGAVTAAANKFTMENGATLQTTSTVTNGSPITFVGEEGGVIDNSADFVQQKSFYGTMLTKKGAGWLKTSSTGASLTKMVIAEGTVQNGSGNAAKTVEIQGGSLVDNVGTNNEITVPEGCSGAWTTGNRCTYTNKITGEGTLTIYCATEKGSGWYATRTPLQLDLSGFTGTIIPQATYAADGRFTLDTGTSMPNGAMEIPAGIEVQNSGKTFRIGKLTGEGSLGNFCTFANNGATGSNTWQAGNDEDFVWKGKVTGSGTSFTKMGSGKMTVSGVWDNTGSVRVSEGQLHINAGASLGTGTLIVASGATLSGRTSDDLTNSSVTISGTCHVGSTENSTTGFMGFGNKNVTFSRGSVLRLGIARGATATNTGGCSLKNINNLSMNATISLYYSSSCTLAEGDSVVLWKANTVSGTPVLESDVIDEAKGLYWDATDLADGILRVKYVKPDAISEMDASAEVQVSVVSASGLVVGNFACLCADVESAFSKMSLPEGIYMLRLQDESGKQKVLKIRKR